MWKDFMSILFVIIEKKMFLAIYNLGSTALYWTAIVKYIIQLNV